jgi:ABC-2 type transport system permease protein
VSTLRLLGIGWLLQLKMRSRSAFDGFLGIVYPIFFATTIFLIYRQNGRPSALVGAAVGASVMGVWSAVSTTASASLQQERRQGTLELLVAAPARFSLIILPTTVAMATIGLYSLVATLAFGRLVFGIRLSFADPFGFVVSAVVTASAIGVVGFLQSVASVRYRSAWALGTAFELPVWLICGFLVPLSLLPSWVRPISWLLPPTWGVAAVRASALGGSPWGDIGWCVVTASAYAAIGAMLSGRLLTSARSQATLALN